MQRIDMLIHARWIVPVDPEDVLFEHHALAVQEGRILAVLPSAEAEKTYTANVRHVLATHALIPGVHLESLLGTNVRNAIAHEP